MISELLRLYRCCRFHVELADRVDDVGTFDRNASTVGLISPLACCSSRSQGDMPCAVFSPLEVDADAGESSVEAIAGEAALLRGATNGDGFVLG